MTSTTRPTSAKLLVALLASLCLVAIAAPPIGAGNLPTGHAGLIALFGFGLF